MLEAAPDARPLSTVGETFDIQMDRTPLNDIPGLVKYSVRNTVTQIESDRLVDWTNVTDEFRARAPAPQSSRPVTTVRTGRSS